MTKIYINRNQSPKRKEKARRKRVVKEWQRLNDMVEAVNQLSLIDAFRIMRRVESEIKTLPNESFNRLLERMALSYKYTLELLSTVAV